MLVADDHVQGEEKKDAGPDCPSNGFLFLVSILDLKYIDVVEKTNGS